MIIINQHRDQWWVINYCINFPVGSKEIEICILDPVTLQTNRLQKMTNSPILLQFLKLMMKMSQWYLQRVTTKPKVLLLHLWALFGKMRFKLQTYTHACTEAQLHTDTNTKKRAIWATELSTLFNTTSCVSHRSSLNSFNCQSG